MPPDAMETKSLILTDVVSACLQLGNGQHFWLRSALGTRLTAVDGIAWITFDQDAGDILILTGQSFVVPPGKMALIGTLRGPLTLDAREAPDRALKSLRPATQ
jgi:hypothetical protein